MSAFAREDEDAGGDDHTLLMEEHVDDSMLKLPTHKFDTTKAVPVKSGEEEEEVVFQERCALFVFSGTEWKERGKGDIKLLKHRESHFVRLIMRQDKTLKLRANHKVEPGSVMSAYPGSEKAYMWKANDFAEEKVVETKFNAQFKNKEKADAFHKAFLEAQENNKAVLTSGGHGKSPAKAVVAPVASGAGSVAATLFAPKPVDRSGHIAPTDNMETIYGADAATDAIIRYGALSTAFKARFGVEPSFFVRAPGRTNIIGEHIDYHGYSVLPMALAQDVVIAVALGGEGVSVANTNEKYAPAVFPADITTAAITAATTATGVQWHHYVQCGYSGALQLAAAKGLSGGLSGLRLLIEGNVPTGAGVSSSSALTVASLIATAHAIGIESHATTSLTAKATRAELAEAARKAELGVGTMSGGMDQAIAVLATAGSASRIDFEPVTATPVPLPAGVAFVVANTLEESAKAVDAEKRYNKRVTEGKLAAKLVAKGAGLPAWQRVQTFRQLQSEAKLSGPNALLPLIEKHLKADAYSLGDLAEAFGVEPATLFEGDIKKDGALKVIASVGKDEKTFELRKRARHVASEAERVLAFEAAALGKLRNADGSTTPLEGGAAAQLKVLGDLMDQSQASAREDYDCSSAGLDELTALAKSLGALGSRLTGAGWGGCAVSLVAADRVAEFVSGLKSGFYEKRGKAALADTAIIVSKPGSGAAVYTPPTSFEI